jgi:hypothetical protein
MLSIFILKPPLNYKSSLSKKLPKLIFPVGKIVKDRHNF